MGSKRERERERERRKERLQGNYMIVHTHHISITPHELTMDEDSEIITAQKIIKVAFANIPTCT